MAGEEMKSGIQEGAGVSVRDMGEPRPLEANIMRHEYKTLTRDELDSINMVKNQGLAFYAILNGCKPGREISIAKTKIEEAVLWAVKGLTACFVLFLMVGCATHAQLAEDHIARTLVSEERSAFGTNMGFAKLQHCEKKYVENGFYEPVNCKDLTPWTPMYSQGVGGQIVGGALTGLGFGLGSAFSGAGNAASSVSNSTTNVITKGGHH